VDEPVPGRMIRSASDQCPGTIQWVDPGRPRIGVRWADGTTSTEPTGDERGWEWMDGWGHVCGPACWCPDHKRDTWYHPGTGTHACQRVDCRYAGGLEAELVRQQERARERAARPLPPGWVGSHPGDVPDA
jgi:hypothetical protein